MGGRSRTTGGSFDWRRAAPGPLRRGGRQLEVGVRRRRAAGRAPLLPPPSARRRLRGARPGRSEGACALRRDLGKKYCVYCLAEVSPLRFRCTECQDIELCPECFSAGAEIGHHRRYHGYQLVDGRLDQPRGAAAAGCHRAVRLRELGRHGSPRRRFPDPPGSDGALHISVAEQQQLGYMPLRDDYEIEYDQDAETLISGLSVNYDDEDVEIELKRAHVDMYVRKLRERQRRKNIARDYNLVPAFLGKDKKEKERAARRKVTKEEKELRLKLRPLYQFMSCKEFDDLFENMHKEKMLRAKIRELQRYRRNGITKMEESAEYEAARHKREKRKENKAAAAAAAAAGGTKRGKEDGRDGEFAAIEHLPGFELLSDREKVLCSSLNLSPARYVTVKTIIIKDHLQKRQGIPSKSRLPSYLDKVLKKRILSFLTESGWISRDAS
ncbi:transcriptional adapter 2-beta [Oryx dammah]|uniref:transcriptional adapter 2-beta n=1 Tax=Oryx dammah TaxID=59534 RepID=UPI001A9AC88E|nr:transcriptional adapter 2-beta [Oryx dammah]